jgi:hypothetical protein
MVDVEVGKARWRVKRRGRGGFVAACDSHGTSMAWEWIVVVASKVGQGKESALDKIAPACTGPSPGRGARNRDLRSQRHCQPTSSLSAKACDWGVLQLLYATDDLRNAE